MAAYYELKDKSDAYANEMKSSISVLKNQLESERAAWKSAVRKAKRPGIGVFVGGGVTSSGGVEAVIGIGFVWKLF